MQGPGRDDSSRWTATDPSKRFWSKVRVGQDVECWEWTADPSHLFLGTHGDNMRDMHAKGRQIGNRRLSDSEARQVIELRNKAGLKLREIASAYGITTQQVRNLALGLQRKYLGAA